jgi:hypothetical protein
MNSFSELRRQAREKRDKAINIANDIYSATLTRIAALEQDLTGHNPSTHRTLSDCINNAMPFDRPFTTIDVMAALEGMDPTRAWRKLSINNHMGRMRRAGIIRRLRRPSGKQPAQYVRLGVQVEPSPCEGKTLTDVLLELLPGKAMTLTELAVTVLEAGFPTKMKARGMRCAIGQAVRKDRRFAREGGKWALA